MTSHADQIQNIDEAKQYVDWLITTDKFFHLEDDPATIFETLHYDNGVITTGNRTFTDREATLVSERVNEMYALQWGAYECPIGYYLAQMEETAGAGC